MLAFGLYTAMKASYLSTVFSTRRRGAEPDLPRAAALRRRPALALERGRLRWWALLGTAGFVLYVILTTPYQLDLWPYSDALGFSIVQMANRDLAFDDRDVTWLLVVVLIVSVALLVAPRLLARPAARRSRNRRRRRARSCSPGTLTGEISASNGTNNFSQMLLGNFPSPPNWLDKATGGSRRSTSASSITDPQGIWLMEFWNRSLKYVWSLDATAPGPGTTPPGYRDARRSRRTAGSSAGRSSTARRPA